MNKYFILLIVLFFASCGADDTNDGKDSEIACTKIESESGFEITCEDVTILAKNGKDGMDGDIGPQGEQGDIGEMGPQGETGERGEMGPQGEKGDTGEMGPQGETGDTGEDAILEIIDPCGPIDDAPTYANEIIIRLNSGDLLVYFENGGKRYLSLIGPGTYITTDSQKCVFTITDDLAVLY